MAIGLLYLWLANFPLARGEAWSWWTLLLSGTVGFGSFLSYLGYGYLDTWHGTGTVALLPLFVFGMYKSRRILRPAVPLKTALRNGLQRNWKSISGLGRALMLFTALGMILAGATIMVVGMTTVFVPQDLEYMKVTKEDLHELNPKLIPLIAHDRAGFGGGLCSCGFAVLLSVWCARPSRSLWQVLLLAGLSGFGAAIGVHFAVGYTDFMHLAPAYTGFGIYLFGLCLIRTEVPR